MWDNVTGSVWSQLDGVAVSGPLQGAQLPILALQTTTWGAWLAEHPDSTTLDLRATGFSYGARFSFGRAGLGRNFRDTLDEIDLSGSRVVLASDEHPRKIRKFSQALISRFLSGMVVKIERPDRATRIELIRQMSVVRGLRVSQVAVEEIAAHCVGSIRELEGAITKLYALKTLINPSGDELADGGGSPSDEIGLVIAEQLFKDQGWQPTTPIRMVTILDHVCDRLAISRADLLSSGRHRRVVLARALVAYLGRDLTTQSYPEIARELGRSYHSTVHTAAQRLKKQMHENANIDLGGSEKPVPLRELVDQLRHEILKATGKS